jgi:hypothetical protein
VTPKGQTEKENKMDSINIENTVLERTPSRK